MNPDEIRKKFGDDYTADDTTFIMGIDLRFTTHFARRFHHLNVLETCTGGGFTTLSLARAAAHVFTVEIDAARQAQAIRNIEKAGLVHKVSFVHGSILDPGIRNRLGRVDAAFIDPDWAVTGPDHVYRFIRSTTVPPADTTLERIFELTGNVALVLPPFVDTREFDGLPPHECQRLWLGSSHELYCLYFGKLMEQSGRTDFRVQI